MHRINQASASENAEGPAGNGATAIALHSHLHPVKSKAHERMANRAVRRGRRSARGSSNKSALMHVVNDGVPIPARATKAQGSIGRRGKQSDAARHGLPAGQPQEPRWASWIDRRIRSQWVHRVALDG
jgi:hypothetical protein